MGTIGNKYQIIDEKVVPFKYTEKFLQDAIIKSCFLSQNSIKYAIDGLYVFDWESDKLLETKSGYIYEFEIKISKADFKADFKKKDKHLILESTYKEKKTGEKKSPNYFYYLTPPDILEPTDIPDYAGWITIDEHYLLTIRKSAPVLHKEKLSDAELNLAEKFYYNMQSWKDRSKDANEAVLTLRDMLNEELEKKDQEVTYKEMEKLLELTKEREERTLKELNAANIETIWDRIYIHKLRDVLDKNNVPYNADQLWKETEKHYYQLYTTQTPVTKANIEEAKNLLLEIFPYCQDTECYKESLKKGANCHYWILSAQGKNLGISGIYTNDAEPETAWLGWFGVRRCFRRCHIGTKALEMFETYAMSAMYKYVRLCTEKDNNEVAKAFYKANGYTEEPCQENDKFCIFSKSLVKGETAPPWGNKKMIY